MSVVGTVGLCGVGMMRWVYHICIDNLASGTGFGSGTGAGWRNS